MIKKKTVALLLAILMISASSIAFADTKAVNQGKLAGTDRYKTAIEVSKSGWSKADKAILVNGTALPDALCVAPLADEYNAPILLTQKYNLNQDTLNELKRLGVKEVTLVGSEGVIAKSQEDVLKANGFSVQRIGGVDRYDTSVKIAQKLKPIYQAKGQRKTVFIANGVKGLADATSVSSPAGIKDAYILYSNGQNLNGIKGFIETSADDVYLIGGTSVISQQVENELRNTTNKAIHRLAGSNRKDTNAKVVDKFFTNKDINNVYVAKDGMGKENELVDALAVGSLASKNGSPVILATGNLEGSQRNVINAKNVKSVTQVGEGGNETAFQQAVSIANSEKPVDGMKLPTINYAKEQNIKINSKYGAPLGGGAVGEAIIKGDLYVKYGDSKLGAHAYGCNNQDQYNKVVSWAKDKVSKVNFRNQSDWVYLQTYFQNPNTPDSYVDPILQQNGVTVDYGSWKMDNRHIITGLQKGIVSRAEAEQLAMYNSVVSHVNKSLPKLTDDGTGWAYSSYNVIFEGKSDCDAYANYKSLIGDMVGMNTMVAGTLEHQDVMIQVGGYWWVNGRTPTIRKNQDPFMHHNMVISAPTYNLESIYLGNV